jgi:hypothetical protein
MLRLFGFRAQLFTTTAQEAIAVHESTAIRIAEEMAFPCFSILTKRKGNAVTCTSTSLEDYADHTTLAREHRQKVVPGARCEYMTFLKFDREVYQILKEQSDE